MSNGHVRGGKKKQTGSKVKNRNDFRPKNPPKPGERKAARKRIVLTNNNALSVPDLEVMTPENAVDPQSAGHVFSIPDKVIDQLRTIEAFKPSQTWRFFRQPSTLLRNESVDLMQRMKRAADAKEPLRLVVTGERVVGKSMLMLQAMANAFMNKWVVINLHEGTCIGQRTKSSRENSR